MRKLVEGNSMMKYNNLYAQKIFDLLSPVIGELMSKGAIRSQCNRLGISEEMIKRDHIESIAEGIRKSMLLFVGGDGARQISDRILRFK